MESKVVCLAVWVLYSHLSRIYRTEKRPHKGPAKLDSIVRPTSIFGAWSHLFASFASSQIYMAKLASKHRTSNICLPTSKNVFDLNQKHLCLPTCKMCLRNMKCLKNLVGAKRARKDRLLKPAISCQANSVGQFRRALTKCKKVRTVAEFHRLWQSFVIIGSCNLTS